MLFKYSIYMWMIYTIFKTEKWWMHMWKIMHANFNKIIFFLSKSSINTSEEGKVKVAAFVWRKGHKKIKWLGKMDIFCSVTNFLQRVNILSNRIKSDFQNMHHEGNFVKFTADRGGIWIFMKNYPSSLCLIAGPFLPQY